LRKDTNYRDWYLKIYKNQWIVILFGESDFSEVSLTFFVNEIYFSFVINNSILPSYAVAMSLIIKCES